MTTIFILLPEQDQMQIFTMFSALRATFFCCFAFLLSLDAYAVSIIAEGRALIFNKDLTAAKQAAIQDAAQQASMQGAVYVSSNQRVRDGILELDDMKIDTLGKVSNIEVLNSRVEGRQYIVQIRAEVEIDQGCPNTQGNNMLKSVAITAFPMLNQLQANLGGLHDVQTMLANQLQQALRDSPYLQTLSAGQINLHVDLQNAPTRQLNDGALTTVIGSLNTLDVQYIVSGIIRDMSMMNPDVVNETNYFFDTYNRLDFKSKKHSRVFDIELFIHDGISGSLIWQKRYQTMGLWPHEPSRKTGYGTSAFNASKYGHSVNKLLSTIASDMKKEFRCRPFSARITRTEGPRIWINAGMDSGLKQGDKLTVYRRSTAYVDGLQTIQQLSSANFKATIDEVHPTFAIATLHNDTGVLNIRPEDIVKSN